jgi:hypothetical protein
MVKEEDRMMSLLQEIKKQTLTLMVAAFGFVAALVWKDAISAYFAGFSANDPVGLTIVAFTVTIIVVIITIILTKLLGSQE